MGIKVFLANVEALRIPLMGRAQKFAQRWKGAESSKSELLRRLIFDAGSFILLFTNEKGSIVARGHWFT